MLIYSTWTLVEAVLKKHENQIIANMTQAPGDDIISLASITSSLLLITLHIDSLEEGMDLTVCLSVCLSTICLPHSQALVVTAASKHTLTHSQVYFHHRPETAVQETVTTSEVTLNPVAGYYHTPVDMKQFEISTYFILFEEN